MNANIQLPYQKRKKYDRFVYRAFILTQIIFDCNPFMRENETMERVFLQYNYDNGRNSL